MKLIEDWEMQMKRYRTSACLSALIATSLSVVPASAADVVGKWYSRTDVDPVIIIDKAGPEYSGSLVNIDSVRTRLVGDRDRQESVHKTLARLKVAGGNVRFTILKEISGNGDIDYERDTYNLNLSDDGLQLTGTATHLVSYESAFMPQSTVVPIRLFSTSWASRAAESPP